ncbi:MAG: hypothetical protein JST32_12750, partial [Bacteroidetes bacterium]|nr:hypothetical protein [Bacteroidota bacterium]
MKKLLTLLVCILIAGPVFAQVENPTDAAKNGATNATNRNIDNTVNSGINKTEGAIKGLFKKKKKNDNNQQVAVNQQNNTQTASSTNGGGDAGPATITDYKNYDFVPGDKIIFQSNLQDESVGEIPSQFILNHGQMDVQQVDGENVIHIPAGAGATMMPRMKTTAYMPDQFTVEFDFKNEKFGINHLMVDFGNRV